MSERIDRKLNIEATVDNLSRVLGFVDGILEEADCPPKAQMQIDVSVEEIYVNIASYAYAPGVGDADIRVFVEDGTFSITFIDRGIPYDPLAKEDPDVTLDASERQIGGLGIFMTKKMMDDVSYENRDGCNILTLVKKL